MHGLHHNYQTESDIGNPWVSTCWNELKSGTDSTGLTLAWNSAEVRRTLVIYEVCQVAKPGGNKPPRSSQWLYAGRLWQKVAIDLVGPMLQTQRGNQCILVLLDHFARWQSAIPLVDATPRL